MESRDFPTADVLSVTTGKLLSNRRMDGLCDLVAWLTREASFPRFMDEATMRRLLTASAKARDLLIWQHPWLIETQPPDGIDNSDLLDWLLEVETRRGDVMTVFRKGMIGGVVLGLVASVDAAKQALIELASVLQRELPEWEVAIGPAGDPATCKMSEVPIGAHVRHPSTGTWQQVADVVRVRDGSGNIRLTFTNGERLVVGPNEHVEIRATDQGDN